MLRPGCLSDIDEDAVRMLVENDPRLSTRELAEELDTLHPTICRHLKKTGEREVDETCAEAHTGPTEAENKVREGGSGACNTSTVHPQSAGASRESTDSLAPDVFCANSDDEERKADDLYRAPLAPEKFISDKLPWILPSVTPSNTALAVAAQANNMRLAALPSCTVLVTVALALVRQNHYMRCMIEVNTTIPPMIVAKPLWLLMYCGSWCDATPNCSSFCASDVLSVCALYSSIIGREYNGSTSTMSPDVVCYSSAAFVFNIIGHDTAISSSGSSSYNLLHMNDHVYHPCLPADSQTYYTQITLAPQIRFDFGRMETVAAIYVTTERFNFIEIRLGNSSVNADNPVITYVCG
ncbi:hypothetical protein FHG87_017156 [Trinorchestia longiramus]|nr:hypothetical protein FHG87_017156 [Trinorchestia longiramus]